MRVVKCVLECVLMCRVWTWKMVIFWMLKCNMISFLSSVCFQRYHSNQADAV